MQEGDLKRLERIGDLLSRAIQIAKQYREETGKPLGITGEVAEYEAARKLSLELSQARQPGYDAVRRQGCKVTKIQIKGRRVPRDARRGQRIGSISLDHEWDSIVLVILDEDFEPIEMWEATRSDVERALQKPGSKARNIRGALGIPQFKSIAKSVWSRNVGDS